MRSRFHVGCELLVAWKARAFTFLTYRVYNHYDATYILFTSSRNIFFFFFSAVLKAFTFVILWVKQTTSCSHFGCTTKGGWENDVMQKLVRERRRRRGWWCRWRRPRHHDDGTTIHNARLSFLLTAHPLSDCFRATETTEKSEWVRVADVKCVRWQMPSYHVLNYSQLNITIISSSIIITHTQTGALSNGTESFYLQFTGNSRAPMPIQHSCKNALMFPCNCPSSYISQRIEYTVFSGKTHTHHSTYCNIHAENELPSLLLCFRDLI